MSTLLHHITSAGHRPYRLPMAAAVMLVGYLACSSPAFSATFGHSRLVSAVGEPLLVTIPVTQLSAAEADTLRIVPAPASAWVNAGLTPPVDTATLEARLVDGYTPGSRIIQLRSDQTFNQPIVDLLLDIHTSSGVQRYQVSLLAQGGITAVQAPTTTATAQDGVEQEKLYTDTVASPSILIRRGDTMFAVAQRHAVSGVTVYQMMMALQRANPQAFIHNNVNLVKAGERLVMPDRDALTAISDREARRLFHEQVVAFNAYRQSAGELSLDGATTFIGTPPVEQTPSSDDSVSNIPEARVAGGDHLKLSSGRTSISLANSSQDVDSNEPESVAGEITTDAAHQTSSAEGPGSDVDALQRAADAPSQNAARHEAAEGISFPDTASQEAGASSLNGTAQADAAQSVSADKGAQQRNGQTSARNGNAPTLVADASSAEVGAHRSHTNAASGDADAQSDSNVRATSLGSAADGVDDDGSRADDALAASKAIKDAEARVSVLEENVKNLNQALQSQGEAAIDVVVDGAVGLRQSLTDVATAVTDATIGDDELLDDVTADKQGDVSKTKASQDKAVVGMMDSIAAWVHANFIGVVVALLALIALIIAWVLRRANDRRDDTTVTPEMVKEKLNEINLDLREPTVDDSARRS